jgi:hypothetical protein
VRLRKLSYIQSTVGLDFVLYSYSIASFAAQTYIRAHIYATANVQYPWVLWIFFDSLYTNNSNANVYFPINTGFHFSRHCCCCQKSLRTLLEIPLKGKDCLMQWIAYFLLWYDFSLYHFSCSYIIYYIVLLKGDIM